jgi:hypothetical protein
MEDKFDTNLMDLQFQLSSTILKLLPPTNRDLLFSLMFIYLYRNLQAPREVSSSEAKRILERYQKNGVAIINQD